MLDPGRDAPARDALAEEAQKQIEGGGTLKHENNWGLRKMAYEIDAPQRGRLPLVPLRGAERAARERSTTTSRSPTGSSASGSSRSTPTRR